MSALSQTNTPERARSFWRNVGFHLCQGFVHNVAHDITFHLENHQFLNTHELEAISDVMHNLDNEVHDITVNLCESQNHFNMLRCCCVPVIQNLSNIVASSRPNSKAQRDDTKLLCAPSNVITRMSPCSGQFYLRRHTEAGVPSETATEVPSEL
ncbi:uncharacterized protein MELLADRAFT_113686 [Melampsora larici-populina 98AG31]|uniref:Uncharacterized protein n=1 Tax=Melampsora larici-populina (strain 98AG31 / pathotype 3-4-7) TaxID=747676 RepID=F4SAR5_MELLP|nr:uncharacterized protein MELLADRAFT_113686 [Melampsora larici-populina 98AG31]EGF98271.1 hypothetical protein MELLADRAFT_113686 [Melampsora larici-populina 98AG31]